jgi:hypothetical protein
MIQAVTGRDFKQAETLALEMARDVFDLSDYPMKMDATTNGMLERNTVATVC